MAKNKDFKEALTYICSEKCGYTYDLKSYVGEYLSEFESVGFITKGHSLKAMTWKKTNLADQYFKDLYGIFSFWKLNLSRILTTLRTKFQTKG